MKKETLGLTENLWNKMLKIRRLNGKASIAYVFVTKCVNTYRCRKEFYTLVITFLWSAFFLPFVSNLIIFETNYGFFHG